MVREVFAHYMVGLTDGQSLEQWRKEINDAAGVGIDGFALNVGPRDPWTLPQLRNAFDAADASNFKLFISFDQACCGDWEVQQVTDTINEFKTRRSHFIQGDRPVVSTFEGPAWSDNWAAVKSGTGGIFLIPDWSSLGPFGVRDKGNVHNGHFSWNAWPNAGEKKKNTEEDKLYLDTLGDKPYMMGVSPWFYTNLPQYGKNWHFSSDSLWYDRWEQVLDLLPDMIQIITWNDFGEASYISDIVPAQIVSGAEKYTNGFDHKSWRAVLPYYIAAYKAGNRGLAPQADEAVAWYRQTTAKAGSDGGTIWGQTGGLSASDATDDVVNVMTVTVDQTDIEVIIGGRGQTFRTGGGASPASFFQVPFDGATGDVVLRMNGQEVVGPAIGNSLPNGYVDFAVHAIGL